MAIKVEQYKVEYTNGVVQVFKDRYRLVYDSADKDIIDKFRGSGDLYEDDDIVISSACSPEFYRKIKNHYSPEDNSKAHLFVFGFDKFYDICNFRIQEDNLSLVESSLNKLSRKLGLSGIFEKEDWE